MTDEDCMALAREQARHSLEAGGVPVGSVLVRAGAVIGAGHNQRVQKSDPIAHGEMDCIRNAGLRQPVIGAGLAKQVLGQLFEFPRHLVVIEHGVFGTIDHTHTHTFRTQLTPPEDEPALTRTARRDGRAAIR